MSCHTVHAWLVITNILPFLPSYTINDNMPFRSYHITCHAHKIISYDTMPCPSGHTIYHAMPPNIPCYAYHTIPYTMQCLQCPPHHVIYQPILPKAYHIPCYVYVCQTIPYSTIYSPGHTLYNARQTLLHFISCL